MTISDDYSIIGAAADNFDCDSTSGWGTNGVAQNIALNNSIKVEGSSSIEVAASGTGTGGWYHDLSSGSRFKITSEDLMFWFYYVKGKYPAYLVANSTAIIIRLYFGGTTDYADYRVTNNGDADLIFGWQVLQCSGTNLNGGSTSGTWSDTSSNWDRDIYRVELRLTFASIEGIDNAPPCFDCFFSGTKIIVQEGTVASPKTLTDIETYSNTGRTAFPLGLVNVDGVFANLKCGLEIGNGSDGTNNEGNMNIVEQFVLMNQRSPEVKHNFTVKNYSSVIMGKKVIGTDDNYAVRGVQLVLPADRYSDIVVENGGTFKAYNTKFYRWRYIYLGAASDTSTIIELINVDVDSCETIYFRSSTLNLNGIEIHDNANQINDHAGEMIAEPDSCVDFLCHDCDHGVYFKSNMSIDEYISQDNTTYDLGILEGTAVSIINGIFDDSKIIRLT